MKILLVATRFWISNFHLFFDLRNYSIKQHATYIVRNVEIIRVDLNDFRCKPKKSQVYLVSVIWLNSWVFTIVSLGENNEAIGGLENPNRYISDLNFWTCSEFFGGTSRHCSYPYSKDCLNCKKKKKSFRAAKLVWNLYKIELSFARLFRTVGLLPNCKAFLNTFPRLKICYSNFILIE